MSNLINQQNAIYAILADSVYWDVRTHLNNPNDKNDTSKSNWTPIPSNWKLISELQDKSSGFTARAFKIIF